MSSDDIDISSLTKEQVAAGLGDLLLGMLASHKVAFCVAGSNGSITFLNPLILQHIPAEELASSLLEAWNEEEVEKFLEHVYG